MEISRPSSPRRFTLSKRNRCLTWMSFRRGSKTPSERLRVRKWRYLDRPTEKKHAVAFRRFTLSKRSWCLTWMPFRRASKTPSGRVRVGKWRTQQELTPCDPGERRECSFLPLFFWISVVEGGFEKQFFHNCVRPPVHPSRSP